MTVANFNFLCTACLLITLALSLTNAVSAPIQPASIRSHPEVNDANLQSNSRSRLLWTPSDQANNDCMRPYLSLIIKAKSFLQLREQENPRALRTACRSLLKYIYKLLRGDSTNILSFPREFFSIFELDSTPFVAQQAWRVLLEVDWLDRQCPLPEKPSLDGRHRKIVKREVMETDDDNAEKSVDHTNSAESSLMQEVDSALPDVKQQVYLTFGCVGVLIVLCLFMIFHKCQRPKFKKASIVDDTTTSPHASVSSARDGNDKNDGIGYEILDCVTQPVGLQEDGSGKHVDQKMLDNATSVIGVAEFSEEPVHVECDISEHEDLLPLPRPSSPFLSPTNSFADEGNEVSSELATVGTYSGSSSSTTVVWLSLPSSSRCSTVSSDEHRPATTDDICTKPADMGNITNGVVNELQTGKSVDCEALCDAPQLECDSNGCLDPLLGSAQKTREHEQRNGVMEIAVAPGNDGTEERITEHKIVEATDPEECEPGSPHAYEDRPSTVLEPSGLQKTEPCIPIPASALEILSDKPSTSVLKTATCAVKVRSQRNASFPFQYQLSVRNSSLNSRPTSVSLKSEDFETRVARSDSYDPLHAPFQYPTPNCVSPNPFREMSERRNSGSANRRTSITRTDPNQSCSWPSSPVVPHSSPVNRVLPDTVPTESGTYRMNRQVNAQWNPERTWHTGSRPNKRMSIYQFLSSSSRSTTPTEVESLPCSENDGSKKANFLSLNTTSSTYLFPSISTDEEGKGGSGSADTDTIFDQRVDDVTMDKGAAETEREGIKQREIRASMFRDIFTDET